MTAEEKVLNDENKPKGKKKENNATKKKKTLKNAKPAVDAKKGIGVKRNKKDKPKKVKKLGKQQSTSVNQGIDNGGGDANENVLKPADTPKKPNENKHVVFDDDETFDNLPDLTSVAVTKTHDSKEEESDSDAPPDEGTISSGRDIFAEEDRKMKSEVVKLKNQLKEARRLKHEKNREQQKKKKERFQKLEESRLPEDLLNAVVMEKDEPQEAVASQKKKKKRKYAREMIDDDDLITLERGVKVRAVEREVKKVTSIASIAADFRQNALYNKQVKRMSSVDQRMMNVKQKKSGKNVW